ncbi:MAG TPA: sel1 repeat family protein [Kiloniellaceae bacterium]|nr:sel1 repeat family protein [Kiloniellaceae bacterium]HIP77644.1 sel1 repeat family protein [Kiloniellaceae bacterium]
MPVRLWRHETAVTARTLLVILLVMAASTLGSGRPAFADFAEGLEAYDAGDLGTAYAEWLPLAEAGDLQAQVALAGILETGGTGLARDLPAAARWYRRAAVRGDAVAQMNLGQMYTQGWGLAQDRVQALAWFSLAADQGRQWAAERRDALRSGLTAAQREAAATLSRRLRAGY